MVEEKKYKFLNNEEGHAEGDIVSEFDLADLDIEALKEAGTIEEYQEEETSSEEGSGEGSEEIAE